MTRKSAIHRCISRCWSHWLGERSKGINLKLNNRNDSYRRNDLKVIFRLHVRVSDHTKSASREKVQGLLGEIEKISRVPLLLVCLRQRRYLERSNRTGLLMLICRAPPKTFMKDATVWSILSFETLVELFYLPLWIIIMTFKLKALYTGQCFVTCLTSCLRHKFYETR